MKKIYFVMAIVLISTFAFALDAIVIGISDVSASPGDFNISVPVILQNNNSLAILEFNVTYPPYIVFKEARNTSRITDGIIEANDITPTTLKIAAFVPNNISAGSGAIMDLLFDVNSSAIPGQYDVNLSCVLLVDVDSADMNYTITNGVFTIL